MIEVTQKNIKGNVQIIEVYDTEDDFGKAYRWNRRSDITSVFATEHIMIGSHEECIADNATFTRRIADFSKVAYTGKGKVIDPTHLVGLARAHYQLSNYWRYPGTKSSKRHVRGSWLKLIHTTPERRATFACEDQEEYAPKVRARRNSTNLLETWDDYQRFNQKNWKKFRNHQWKSKG